MEGAEFLGPERNEMNLTSADIDSAELLGACPEALKWLREEPRTWGDVTQRYAPWVLVYAAALLTPERLDGCAAQDPSGALVYAAALLTPERLDGCAAQDPYGALVYAAALLTPERLDSCAKVRPWEALRYAAALLTPERLDGCARCP